MNELLPCRPIATMVLLISTILLHLFMSHSLALSPYNNFLIPPFSDHFISINDSRILAICMHSSKYRLSPVYYYSSSMEEEPEIEHPTQTSATRIPLPNRQAKPKVVVLGATGRIGRLIVKRLMASGVDMKVVAFVRNYDKARDILYDDGMLLERDFYTRQKEVGPKLQLVVGDLVPPQEVYGFVPQLEDDNDAVKAAYSAAKFYGESPRDYLKQDSMDTELTQNPNQALIDAIEDATVIISSVGTVRATWPFADYLLRPWRIFRSPKLWCNDPRHPYYVNYHVMKKVLSLTEAEQLRRDSVHKNTLDKQEEIKREALKRGFLYEPATENRQERIKIIRISDLQVAYPAWSFVSCLTNIVRSVVFQSQDMAEILLEQSELVDTVALRPGDLCDKERNSTTTNLQIDTTGKVQRRWSPSNVGRDDVAALAVALALTDLSSSATRKDKIIINRLKDKVSRSKHSSSRTGGDKCHVNRVRHITMAVRWVGEHLSQGRKNEGFPSAQACVESVLRQEVKMDEKLSRLQNNMSASRWSRFVKNAIATCKKRRVKPYGIFILIPILIMYPTIISMLLLMIPTATIKSSWIYFLSHLRSVSRQLQI